MTSNDYFVKCYKAALVTLFIVREANFCCKLDNTIVNYPLLLISFIHAYFDIVQKPLVQI